MERNIWHLKNTTFWDVTQCSPVEVNRRFAHSACWFPACLKVEAVRPSETSINFYQATWRHILETVLFIVTTVKNSNPAYIKVAFYDDTTNTRRFRQSKLEIFMVIKKVGWQRNTMTTMSLLVLMWRWLMANKANRERINKSIFKKNSETDFNSRRLYEQELCNTKILASYFWSSGLRDAAYLSNEPSLWLARY
jgi:hypothetical protein